MKENFFCFILINVPVIHSIWLDDKRNAVFAYIQAAGNLALDPIRRVDIIQLVCLDQ